MQLQQTKMISKSDSKKKQRISEGHMAEITVGMINSVIKNLKNKDVLFLALDWQRIGQRLHDSHVTSSSAFRSGHVTTV